MRKLLSFIIAGLLPFIFENCLAQIMTSTVPRIKPITSIYSSKKIMPSIFLVDGVNVNFSVLKSLNAKDIKSINSQRDSIIDVEILFNKPSIMEITTVEDYNKVLKYINEKSNFWSQKHPLTAYLINEMMIYNDDENKYEKLRSLDIKNIEKIEVVDSEQGQKLLGEHGGNGIIKITIKSQ